mgnify:CR=1 FL=1
MHGLTVTGVAVLNPVGESNETIHDRFSAGGGRFVGLVIPLSVSFGRFTFADVLVGGVTLNFGAGDRRRTSREDREPELFP